MDVKIVSLQDTRRQGCLLFRAEIIPFVPDPDRAGVGSSLNG